MNKLLIASILTIGATQVANADYLSALTGAGGSDIIFEDNSREFWVDENLNGRIDAGDKLEGFLRFDSYDPGQTTNNELYVVFSQTFGSDFSGVAGVTGGTVYSGTFSEVQLDFIDYTGSTNWVDPNTDLSDSAGGIAAALADITSNGTIAFSAGLAEPEDFFGFKTTELFAGVNDFVLDPTLTAEVGISTSLGNFGGGLTVTTNNIDVIFNRSIVSSFEGNGTIPAGSQQNDFLYDIAIVNGNFGGICQETDNNGDCIRTVQGLNGGFLDNADAVMNVTRVPEPTSIALLGLGLLGFSFSKRKHS